MSSPDRRQQILSHMNADHADSLILYLEHFHSLPSHTACHAHLTDISQTSMLISTSKSKPNSNTYRIPFDPPLKDWSEARPRVIALDQEARSALGRSDITIKKYLSPYAWWHWGIWVAILFTFALLGRGRETLDPGVRDITSPFKARFPGFFEFLCRVQPWVLYPTLAIHLAESVWMDRTRLRVHNVPRGGAVWWKWVVSTFVGGFPNFERFDGAVREARRVKEEKRH